MRQWSHANLSQIANAPPATGTRPVGCVRPDRIDTVFFTGNDGHIHQLLRTASTWVHTDLSLAANAPVTEPGALAVTSPTVCVRPDNVVSIVYTGGDSHIHALQIKGDVGSHVDLSNVAGAPRANRLGQTHFVRGDGVVVVVYVGVSGTGSNGDPLRFHVDQLALTGGNWVHSDLSELTQSPVTSIITTAGYVRPDRVTSVVFVDVEPTTIKSKGIREMALPPNGNWTSTNLFSSPSTPLPHTIRWPMGFVRGDGTPAVLYAGFDQGIHELAFVASRWMPAALSQAANAPKMKDAVGGPMGYVRGDSVTAVVYHGDDDHIHELTFVGGNWAHSDLFLLATGTLGEGTPTGHYPFAYVRSDGVSSILWLGPRGQIHELSLPAA